MQELLNDRDIKKSILVLLILLSVFLLVKSFNELKSSRFIGKGEVSENTIRVSGKGEVSAVPDIATFSFSVTEEREEVVGAQDIVSEKISKILDSLEELGINEKDLKTLSYNIYPRYEFYRKQQICPEGFACPPSTGERILIGYEVSQTVSLKIRNIDEAGKVLEALGSLEVSNINGPNFDIEDRDELQREARKIAIDNAKKKAKELSKDLGVRLGRVVNFSEGGRSFGAMRLESAVGGEFGIGGGFAPEIPVGESEISSNVEIVYEIK